MSNEKLEALKLGLLAPHDRQAIDTNRRVDAAHALGFEDGKREAEAKADAELDAKHADLVKVADKLAYVRRELLKFDAENKCLREAAPVDDGRRWEIYVGTVPASSHPGSKTAAEAMRILWDMNTHRVYSLQTWTARLVEPKHVHVWSATSDVTRVCFVDGCHARQIAEWKDEA